MDLERVFRTLRYIEERLDALNPILGGETLCIYCGSQDYSGMSVVHDEKCSLYQLREVIDELAHEIVVEEVV